MATILKKKMSDEEEELRDMYRKCNMFSRQGCQECTFVMDPANQCTRYCGDQRCKRESMDGVQYCYQHMTEREREIYVVPERNLRLNMAERKIWSLVNHPDKNRGSDVHRSRIANNRFKAASSTRLQNEFPVHMRMSFNTTKAIHKRYIKQKEAEDRERERELRERESREAYRLQQEILRQQNRRDGGAEDRERERELRERQSREEYRLQETLRQQNRRDDSDDYSTDDDDSDNENSSRQRWHPPVIDMTKERQEFAEMIELRDRLKRTEQNRKEMIQRDAEFQVKTARRKAALDEAMRGGSRQNPIDLTEVGSYVPLSSQIILSSDDDEP